MGCVISHVFVGLGLKCPFNRRRGGRYKKIDPFADTETH